MWRIEEYIRAYFRRRRSYAFKLLCRMGIHDYEFDSVHRKKKVVWGKLVCFYCCAEKCSSNGSKK